MSGNRSNSIEQCIVDITECPICHDVLQDNRCLPCLHTFCLKCLVSYTKKNSKGEPLLCPICRKECHTLKSVAGLSRNFFIDKLIDAHKVATADVLPKNCEICSEDTKIVPATRFCCDCCQNLCLSCEKQHRKIKATTMHQIIDNSSVTDSKEFASRSVYCSVHTGKTAEVYCQDCKMVICWQCKSLSHVNHVGSEISVAEKDLASQLDKHIEQISMHLQTKEGDLLILTEREKLYKDEIEVESKNICRERSKLYKNITENGDTLRKALCALTTVPVHNFLLNRGKLESAINKLKKHKVYVEQMIHLGNINDLCEYSDKLISETARMTAENSCTLNFIVPPVPHLSDMDLQDLLIGRRTDIEGFYDTSSAKLKHVASCGPTENTEEKLNERKIIQDESFQKYTDWSQAKAITLIGGGVVCGITILNSKLYVVLQRDRNIHVYDLIASVLLTDFTIHGLVNPNDITSCTFYNCLYICDWDLNRIFRVKIGEGLKQMNWSIDEDLGGLSVTAKHNILLAGHRSNKLKEYTYDGELLRSITLEDDFKPWHAIRMVSNEFLICQGDKSTGHHRVCLIDSNGMVKKSFGGDKGSDEKHLCGPYHLAVDNRGYVLVNDCNNRRILLLNQDLKFVKEIIPSSANVLRRARRMCLDKDVGRLYVADNVTTGGETKDGRIQAFSYSHV